MQISTILNNIDNGQMALPEFQRGYVWNRDQVRGFFDSLYRRHPTGGLVVWVTEAKDVKHRGGGELALGTINLLLDGQQRMTSIYGVVRGKAPKFFDGNAQAFTNLYFHLENEIFSFYQPQRMKDDQLWINVTELMQQGVGSFGKTLHSDFSSSFDKYFARLNQLHTITNIEFPIEQITGDDKTIDVVVDIFNQVNTGGTKLSKGDLALAKICSNWPEVRDIMKVKLREWDEAGYHFNLDWLLRSMNTILTGEAKFQFLHNQSADDIQNSLRQATTHIDNCINMISGRLGLDHDRVLFGRFAFPVMVRYLDQRKSVLSNRERDKLLFWFVQAGMWGRFSGSTETYIDQDLAALEGPNGGLDKLLEQLRLWHGGLRVEPGHFTGWSLGARFYPVLYLLTRMGEARDWGTGLMLKASLLGKMNRLEMHHIFPKSRLYECDYKRPEVNALANFCFLTKDTNLIIGNQSPEEYFPKICSTHKDNNVLASQWIPDDPQLWKIENFRDFLEARKQLLADEFNRRMTELLYDETHWLEGSPANISVRVDVVGGISSGEEEEQLEALNEWVKNLNLSPGMLTYEFSDPKTGQQRAVFDLAWPSGIQEELTQPVAVLINEPSETIAVANQAGFRCFVSVDDFKHYVESEILASEALD